MKKYTFLLIVFTICTSNLMGQLSPKNVKVFDSLIKYKKTEKAYNFIKEIDAIQENGSNEKIHSRILFATVLGENKEFEFAKTILDSLLNTKKIYNNQKLLAEAYFRKGVLAHLQNEDSEAINYYLKVDSIADINNSIPNLQINALVNLGGRLFSTLYQDKTSKFSKSEDFYSKALTIAETLNDSTEYYRIKVKLAFIEYGNPQNKKSGIPPIFEKAIKYYKKRTDLNNIFAIYNKLPQLYMLNDNYEKAEILYKDYIKLSQNNNLIYNEAIAKWLYGRLLKHEKRHDESIATFESAIELFNIEKAGDANPYASTLGMLAEEYKSIGKLDKAYETLNLYHETLDSIDRAAELVKVKAIDAKYQTEKKEQEIELLKAKNELSEKQKYIYIAIAGLLLVSGLFLFLGYRNKIKTAQKLNELNELKSRFFANISHEFRTPLTLIKSPVQQLQSNITNEEQNKQLHLIDNNANRMLELVDQLLELSKIDSGKLQIMLKKGNLQHFFQTILEPFSFKAKDENQEFLFTTENLDFEIHFDKDIITKITTNLLDNAFKYNEQGKQIDFVAKKENENLIIKVRNYNSQLKEADYKKLFERFYQKDNAISGFGIGLALVKDLVELYEGTIKADFNNGKISFTVVLPLKKELVNAIMIAENSEIKTEVITEINTNTELPILLVVDDNASIREVIKDIFATNYQILEASNGKEALQIAQKEIPDCIISDVMMPEMDGFEFANQIKSNELTSFIPVILVTAKTSDDAHLKALQNTADAFLTKPFNHEVLKATVTQQIQERKKLQERYSQELVLKPTEVIINSIDEKFIAKLETVLEKAISNSEFNAETFANEMHMSRMQLHRKLKSLFGISATEFIRNERLKTAADLLKNDKLSVSEIAYSVGFNDVGYFSKCFKEMYHLSPSDYQKK